MEKVVFVALLAISVVGCSSSRVKLGPKVSPGGVTVVEYITEDGPVRPEETKEEERVLERLEKPKDTAPAFLYVGELASGDQGCVKTMRRRSVEVTDLYPKSTAIVEVQECQHQNFRDEENGADVLRISCTLVGDGAPGPVQHLQIMYLLDKKLNDEGKDYRPAGLVIALLVPNRDEPLRKCEYHGFLIPEANL